MSHANASVTPAGRLRLELLVVDRPWSYARAAERSRSHASTAGPLVDLMPRGRAGREGARFSRPHRLPSRLAGHLERRSWACGWLIGGGPARIAYHLRMSLATVHTVVHR